MKKNILFLGAGVVLFFIACKKESLTFEHQSIHKYILTSEVDPDTSKNKDWDKRYPDDSFGDSDLDENE